MEHPFCVAGRSSAQGSSGREVVLFPSRTFRRLASRFLTTTRRAGSSCFSTRIALSTGPSSLYPTASFCQAQQQSKAQVPEFLQTTKSTSLHDVRSRHLPSPAFASLRGDGMLVGLQVSRPAQAPRRSRSDPRTGPPRCDLPARNHPPTARSLVSAGSSQDSRARRPSRSRPRGLHRFAPGESRHRSPSTVVV